MTDPYDVVVLGATAAGYVAAIRLAGKGLRVVVVAAPAKRVESPLADWIPNDLLRASSEIKSVRAQVLEESFRQVCFHSAKLDQEATFVSRATLGYFLRAGVLLEALAAKAARAHVERLELPESPVPALGESLVTLRGAQAVQAKLLLWAQDEPANVQAQLGLPGRSVPVNQVTIAGLNVPLPKGQDHGLAHALHVVTFPAPEQLGMYFALDGLLHMRVISTRGSEPADVSSLTQLVIRLQEAGLIAARLSLSRSCAAIWQPPGGVALELEAHLAKRTLLVGTAGGFASALTGQTLDPSIRSALVAADVAATALKARQVQDGLAAFKGQWRESLAGRIRLPETALRMLLPLIFTNKVMADRFARSLLYGESI
jgi:flavin-dependent dehydrogenase